MSQAIITRYLGPTDHKGARIRASAQAGTVVIPFDHGDHDPHDIAALALMRRFGWTGTWIGGGLADKTGNCYVRAEHGPDYTIRQAHEAQYETCAELRLMIDEIADIIDSCAKPLAAIGAIVDTLKRRGIK